MNLFPRLFLSTVLFSAPIFSHSASMLVEEYAKGNVAEMHKIASNKQIYTLNPCKLQERERVRTVSFIALECPHGSIPYLIHYGSRNPWKPSNRIQILDYKKIGKNLYLEFRFAEDPTELAASDRQEKLEGEGNVKSLNSIPLSNLAIFLELFKNSSRRTEGMGEMEIFFDTSCPLRYLRFNHDFYWDDLGYYEFEITCLAQDNKPAVIHFKSDKLGRIPLNNRFVNSLDSGKLYLARSFLEKWKGNVMVWRDPILYSYVEK